MITTVTSTAHRLNTKLPLANTWEAYCKGGSGVSVAAAAVRWSHLLPGCCYLCEDHQEDKGGETHFDALGDLRLQETRVISKQAAASKEGESAVPRTHPGEREEEESQARERDERDRREGAQEPEMHGSPRRSDSDSVSTGAGTETTFEV